MIWLFAAYAGAPSATDLVQLQWARTPVVTPDGLVLLTGRAALDEGAEEPWSQKRSIIQVPFKGGSPAELVSGDKKLGGPVFGASGAWGFHRDDGIEVMNGSTPTPIDLELEPEGFDFSKDGEHIRFVASPASEADPVRQGDAHRFEIGERARLYTVPVGGGEPKALTDGSVHVVDFVEGDGAYALIVSDENNAYESRMTPRLGLLQEGAFTPIEGAEGCLESVRFSPDGDTLAWIGCATGGLTDAVFVHSLDTGRTRRLLDSQDVTYEQLEWTPDGRYLVTQVAKGTQSELWRFTTFGPPNVVATELAARGFSLGEKGRYAYAIASRSDQSGQLISIDLRSGKKKVLWDPNPQSQQWSKPKTQIVRWASPEGPTLEGLLHRPADAVGPVPLVVTPHGGPDGVSTQRFSLRVHYLTSRGYAVFEPNYRGGIAYGSDFYAANRGRLGTIEFMDIEAGVDALIAKKLAKEDELFYGGWSWGGYLSAWTIGHTDRYRAAVAGAAVVDTVAQYVGSDINHGVAAEWEYTGLPWTKPQAFADANPSRFLKNAKTPTLVLHGTADRRVPFDQGVTLYRALKELGVEVDFWVYPDQGHGIRNPAHVVHLLETWADWYEAH